MARPRQYEAKLLPDGLHPDQHTWLGSASRQGACTQSDLKRAALWLLMKQTGQKIPATAKAEISKALKVAG